MPQLHLFSQEKKTIVLAALGGALEFYDFIIYVIFAPLISEIFFPQSDRLASLMSVYAIFAIGYFIRPLGGIIFSHFGDKYGRKKTFLVSIALMAIPTFLIGLLPTYEQLGLGASLLLIILRVLQGLSIGGEIPGALTFTCEHVARGKRSFACGVIFSFLNIGILLGNSLSLLLNQLLTAEQLASYGWRIPFLLGGALGLISFIIRRQLSESPLFLALHSQHKKTRLPFFEALANHWRQILQGVGLTVLACAVINLLFLYLPGYLSGVLTYPKQQAHLFTTITLVIYTFLMLFFCWMGDRLGRRRLLCLGALGFSIFSYLIFVILSFETTASLSAALLLIALLSSMIMVYPSLLVDLFPTSIRFTGIAIAYNITFAIFGGLTPLIATLLIKYTQNKLAPGYYLILCALLCLFSLTTIRTLCFNKNGPGKIHNELSASFGE
ncbi:MFS transporter [Legionella quinlivanii]|uniref:MFS transporter n=1 Tax=Legionella quinlivanii TaxID=45073 RepID=A0A364LHI0_9GAMM|nr:MFS transporter [Legionella quinlivanii]RAP35696.1 MFS transporter [Legionella quinlivanii]